MIVILGMKLSLRLWIDFTWCEMGLNGYVYAERFRIQYQMNDFTTAGGYVTGRCNSVNAMAVR